MKRVKKYSQLIFILLLLSSVSLLVFRDLPQTFFQQDEWHNFGYVILNDYKFSSVLKNNWVSYLFGRGRLLAMFLNFNLVKFFKLNASYYALLSIALHTINTYLVFIFTSYFFKRKTAPLIAALFFLLNSVSHQAVTWFGTISGTEPAALFTLLSLIFFVKYLKKQKKKFYYWSIILLMISLGFKESSLFLFLFLPLFDYIWKEKKDRRILPFLKSHSILLFLGFGLFIIRFTPFLKIKDTGLFLGGESDKGEFIYKLIYNAVFYPLESLSQIFIYPGVVFGWAKKLVELKFNFLLDNVLAQQTFISEYISVILSVLIVSFLIIAHKYLFEEKQEERKLLLVSTSFILLSVLPYVILKKGSAYLESRYYYLPSIGAGMLLGLIILKIADFVTSKMKSNLFKVALFYFVIMVLIIPYFRTQVYYIRQHVEQLIEIGATRKTILHQIIETYPAISKKAIFYTESTTSFYGQPPEEKMLPFQSGFGQTLLVWYSFHGEKTPTCFFENDFLWDLLSQGYKECEERGFGYFRDYDRLLEAIRQCDLQEEHVYAFFYDAEQHKLLDVTSKTREKIENDLQKLEKVFR